MCKAFLSLCLAVYRHNSYCHDTQDATAKSQEMNIMILPDQGIRNVQYSLPLANKYLFPVYGLCVSVSSSNLPCPIRQPSHDSARLSGVGCQDFSGDVSYTSTGTVGRSSSGTSSLSPVFNWAHRVADTIRKAPTHPVGPQCSPSRVHAKKAPHSGSDLYDHTSLCSRLIQDCCSRAKVKCQRPW